MRRAAVLFTVTVFLPSLVLALLALRSASEQRLVLERRTAALYQAWADDLAGRARGVVGAREAEFRRALDELLRAEEPSALAPRFAERLAVAGGPDLATGFAATTTGRILSPDPLASRTGDAQQAFLAANAAFLSGSAPAQVFAKGTATKTGPAEPGGDPGSLQAATQQQLKRKVLPQQQAIVPEGDQPSSELSAQVGRFAALVGDLPAGTLARFAGEELQVAFFARDPRRPDLVFGGVVTARDLLPELEQALKATAAPAGDVCLALLDEEARPVFRSIPGFDADWRRPFVSTEVGEVLPHWEAAVYLADPARLARSARTLSLALVATAALALGAIAWGSLAVAGEVRKKLELARQRTDFVSAVSHELRTPLTSIRVFANLLGREDLAPEKRSEYLGVLARETERLTRLVDNVLDFARLERAGSGRSSSPGMAAGSTPSEVDLHPVLLEAFTTMRPVLERAGFAVNLVSDPPPLRALADPAAVGRIVLNLLANAEKYGGGARREVVLESREQACRVEVSVLDRGQGVPAGSERRIFEPFERAHEDLTSAAGGAGLGLALGRRLAEAQGGTLVYAPRPGGGSRFTLTLPAPVESEALASERA